MTADGTFLPIAPHKRMSAFRKRGHSHSDLQLHILDTHILNIHPGKKNQKNCPLSLASVYYDVLNHISINSSNNSTNASECEYAASHLRQTLPGDLSILYRGKYNAFWLFA
jgi:hypothetical protein